MDIEIKTDENLSDVKIIICAPRMTDEINGIIALLSQKDSHILCGYKDGRLEIINPSLIYRIYAESKKVYAETEDGLFLIKMRIYRLLDILDCRRFVRISNSEIINLDKVAHFDLNHVGTICVKLKNGEITYVSRRYVSEIKRVLGL